MKRVVKYLLLFLMIGVLFYFGNNILKDKKNNDVLALEYENIEGKYEISYLKDDKYIIIDEISFGRELKEEMLDVDLTGDITLKIRKVSGGLSFIDYIGFDGSSATTDNEYINKKLKSSDLDVIEITEEGLIVNFSNVTDGKLKLVGRIEGKEKIGMPFILGAKRIDGKIVPIEKYTLDTNKSTMNINELTQNPDINDTFVVYETNPHTGHPDGKAYIWVENDDEYLYVMTDWTSDNTYDYGHDFFRVYVGTDDGIKSYTQYSDRGEYGKTYFDYTTTVEYEHMQYKIRIPLSDINQKDIKLGFELYGTGGVFFTFNHSSYDIIQNEEFELSIHISSPSGGANDLVLLDITDADDFDYWYDLDYDGSKFESKRDDVKILFQAEMDLNHFEGDFTFPKMVFSELGERTLRIYAFSPWISPQGYIDGIFNVVKAPIKTLEDNEIKITSLNDKALDGLYFKAIELNESSILNNEELKNKLKDKTDKELIKLFDFSLYNSIDNTKVTDFTDYELEIIIPFSRYNNYKDFALVYINDNGDIEILNTEVTKDGLKILVNHLSEYGLLGNVNNEKNPPTGDINIYLAGGIILVSICIIIFIKKKLS